MQPIFDLMNKTSADYTHTSVGRDVMVSHIKYLRESKMSRVHQVDPDMARRFSYCLYSYLRNIAVDVKNHWPVMVINNLNSPEDFDVNVKQLIIPDLVEVTDILTVADL